MPTNNKNHIVYVIGVQGTEGVAAISTQFDEQEEANSSLPQFEQDFETTTLVVKPVEPGVKYEMAPQGMPERR